MRLPDFTNLPLSVISETFISSDKSQTNGHRVNAFSARLCAFHSNPLNLNMHYSLQGLIILKISVYRSAVNHLFTTIL